MRELLVVVVVIELLVNPGQETSLSESRLISSHVGSRRFRRQFVRIVEWSSFVLTLLVKGEGLSALITSFLRRGFGRTQHLSHHSCGHVSLCQVHLSGGLESHGLKQPGSVLATPRLSMSTCAKGSKVLDHFVFDRSLSSVLSLALPRSV